jgi:hypothetical protein
MTYDQFKDSPVWQTAAELYTATEELLEHRSFAAAREFRNQSERAALCMSNHIAEGLPVGHSLRAAKQNGESKISNLKIEI